jgi:hypothetical protein
MAEAALPAASNESNSSVGLARLFEHQDQALSHNRQKSERLRKACAILDRSIRLNLSILGSMRFEAEKQTAIRLLAVDTISHVIISARIGLWGALPESLSVLRGGIESCAQLAYVISERLYRTAILEIKSKRLNRLEYKTACAALGTEAEGFQRRWEQISNLASHATSRRLQQSEYKIGGEPYDRLGFAEDPTNAEITTGECAELSQMGSVSLTSAFEQDGITIDQRWISEIRDLHEALQAVKSQLRPADGDSVSSDDRD